jgi:hypothetical protein
MDSSISRRACLVLTVSAATLLCACGDDTPTDSSADASNTGGDAATNLDPASGTTVQPTVGVWTYDQQGIQNNTCGEYAVTDEDTPFRVISSANGRFEVEQRDPGNFDCAITGSTFTCPSRLYDEVAIDNTDAVLTYNVRIAGNIDSPDLLAGIQTVDVTCAGNACAAAPAVLGFSLPCAWEVPFEAEFRL